MLDHTCHILLKPTFPAALSPLLSALYYWNGSLHVDGLIRSSQKHCFDYGQETARCFPIPIAIPFQYALKAQTATQLSGTQLCAFNFVLWSLVGDGALLRRIQSLGSHSELLRIFGKHVY